MEIQSGNSENCAIDVKELLTSLTTKDENPSKRNTLELNIHHRTQLQNSKQKKAKKKKGAKKKTLSRKEYADLGLFHLPTKALKYNDLLPLHELWKGYMSKHLPLKNGEIPPSVEDSAYDGFSKILVKSDFHGAIVTVVRSRCPSLVGANGIVVMDTKNTFKVLGRDNKLRKFKRTFLETNSIYLGIRLKIKKEHIKQIDLKTDNAGIIIISPESMYILAKKRGIILSSYNYNEAQLGKDQCDREAAIFKSYAERWLLEKETHKISTAKELLHAIFSNGEPKNTKMCVLEIDKYRTTFENIKPIKNISCYHSVKFEENGALYREYYDIGDGKFHEYSAIPKMDSIFKIILNNLEFTIFGKHLTIRPAERSVKKIKNFMEPDL